MVLLSRKEELVKSANAKIALQRRYDLILIWP